MKEKLTIQQLFDELETLLKKKIAKADNDHARFLESVLANVLLQKNRFEQVYKENHD